MISWFKGKSSMETESVVEAPATMPSTETSAPLTDAERQRLVAAAIDAASDARYKAAAEAKLKDPTRKLQWRPDIEPTSPVWHAIREKFRHYLKKKSVLSVLEAQFDEEQRLYIHPPAINGEILFIQNRDTALYEDFFEPEGRFHGVPNNLATKLTMLKFGLPIAPLTLNNILNSAKDGDVDDEEDEPEDLPRVQRIMYAEKPLEFLNKYHERAQGYPILRTELPKYFPPAMTPQMAPAGVPRPDGPTPPMPPHHGNRRRGAMAPMIPAATNPTMPPTEVPQPPKRRARPHHGMHAHFNVPVEPQLSTVSTTVSMRGGAGAPVAVPAESRPLKEPRVGEPGAGSAAKSRWLFGVNHKKCQVNDHYDSFLQAASQLLGFNTGDQFEFHIDIYEDKAEDGSRMRAMKPYQRTIDIDEENFEMEYAQQISRSLFNYTSDWILVVRPPRDVMGGEKVSPNYNPYVARTINLASAVNPRPSTNPRPSVNPTPSTNLPPMIEYPSSEFGMRTIYGTNGKIILRNSRMISKSEFKAMSLRLIGRHYETKDWAFSIDIRRLPEDDVPERTVEFTKRGTMDDYDTVFNRDIQPIFQRAPPWNMFVRPTNMATPRTIAGIEPEPSRMDVIRFKQDGVGTSYWRIPRVLRDDYGINQIQPGFRNALQILNPIPPSGELLIDNQSLGRGSFELSPQLWTHLRTRLRAGVREFDVFIVPNFETVQGREGYARYVSRPKEVAFSATDFDEMFNVITPELGDAVAPAQPPAQFRVWKSPAERASGNMGTLMRRRPAAGAVAALRQTFADPGYVEIASFRCEWSEFDLQVTGDRTSTVKWRTQQMGTLESFRNALKQLFNDQSLADNMPFSITESKTDGSGRVFVIAGDTTESEWQTNVYDWLQSIRLSIQRDVRIPYLLDRLNQWGVFYQGRPEIARPPVQAATPEDQKAIDALGKQMDTFSKAQEDAENAARMQPPPPAGMGGMTGGTGMTGAGGMAGTMPPPMNTAPRFNKSRNEAERAGKHPPHGGWTKFSAESRALDALQSSSYTIDQGVVVPGRAPAAPMFSESVELQLKVSDSLPTIYSQRLTPTDFRQLQEYNQILRNAVLQRMWNCPICAFSIKDYEEDAKVKHIQDHQDREKVNGVCNWCGDTQWGFMTVEQRAKHLRQHVETEDTMKMKTFWDAHDCPACNTSFKHMKPEDIVAHCINRHVPGIVQFCDRCGIHETHLTRAHRDHHDRKCKEQLPGAPASDFCPRCGKDVSKQTPEQAMLHTRDCHVNGGHFCQICGLDVAHFTAEAHRSHALVCKRPGGPKKTYCRKCGKRLAETGTVEWHSHNETCWKKRDPPAQNPLSSAQEFDKLAEQKEKIAVLTARWTSMKDYVEQRQDSLDQREIDVTTGETDLQTRQAAVEDDFRTRDQDLRERENALDYQQRGLVPPPTDLGMCPFDECMQEIGTMSRRELFSHLAFHAQEVRDAKLIGVQFPCPITNTDGSTCGVLLDPAHPADLGGHLIHRLGSHARQAAAKQACKYAEGTNARLRQAARNLRASNQAAQAYGGFGSKIGDSAPPPEPAPSPKKNMPPPQFPPPAPKPPAPGPTTQKTRQKGTAKPPTGSKSQLPPPQPPVVEPLKPPAPVGQQPKLPTSTGGRPSRIIAEAKAERERSQAYWAKERAEEERLTKLQDPNSGPERISIESRDEKARTENLWAEQVRQQNELRMQQDADNDDDDDEGGGDGPSPPPLPPPPKPPSESASQRARRLARERRAAEDKAREDQDDQDNAKLEKQQQDEAAAERAHEAGQARQQAKQTHAARAREKAKVAQDARDKSERDSAYQKAQELADEADFKYLAGDRLNDSEKFAREHEAKLHALRVKEDSDKTLTPADQKLKRTMMSALEKADEEGIEVEAPIDPTDIEQGTSSRRTKRPKTRHADPIFHPVAQPPDEEEEEQSTTAEDLVIPKRKGRPTKITATPSRTKKRKQAEVEEDYASTSTATSRQLRNVSSPAKKQKKAAEPVEPTRRTTRATSTPAPMPKKPEASPKKAGRPRLLPPSDDEEKESEEEVPVVKASPVKKAKKSPAKK